MKKWGFLLFMVLILAGCGGGSRGGDTVTVNLKVDITNTQAQAVNGETLHIEGPGVSFSCSQSPTPQNPNDPAKCDVPTAGSGNTAVPMTFKSLPAENATYTFTDVSVTPIPGSCAVTITNSTSLNGGGATATCQDIGSGSPNQLVLTFTLT